MVTAEEWQPAFLGNGQIRYYSLARHALIEALRLVGVGPGSKVLMPEYICRDLLATLHLLGATPCWYAVAPDMEPAEAPAEWPVADIVIAVNYFGFPQNLEPFKTYAQLRAAVVIEDNAHGYLSRDQNGNWLGCRTGLGVFSLRKTLRIPDGGALWISPEFAEHKLPLQIAFNGSGVNSAQLIKARLRRIPLLGESAYRLSIATARKLRKIRTGSTNPLPDPASEKLIPVPANPWKSLLKDISENIRSFHEIERRRVAYKNCALVGEDVGAVPVFPELTEHCVPYAYAFRGNKEAMLRMQSYAAHQGYDFVSWPDVPNEIARRAPPHYLNVFLINFLW